MLTFRDHPVKIDRWKNLIEIWDDEKNDYEAHTFEFIEDLYELIQEEKKKWSLPSTET